MFADNVLSTGKAYVFRPRNTAEEARLAVFKEFDTDGDGNMSLSELQVLLRTLKSQGRQLFNLTDSDFKERSSPPIRFPVSRNFDCALLVVFGVWRLVFGVWSLARSLTRLLWRHRFRQADRDGNNTLSPDEFVQLAASIEDAEEVDWPRIVGFAEFDSDGNGSLDKEEFVIFLSKKSNRRYTAAEAAKLFDKFDVNSDGQLDLEEWSRLTDSGALDPPDGAFPDKSSESDGAVEAVQWAMYHTIHNHVVTAPLHTPLHLLCGPLLVDPRVVCRMPAREEYVTIVRCAVFLQLKRRLAGAATDADDMRVREWTPALEAKMAACPFEDYSTALKDHLDNGAEADVIITDTSVNIMLHTSNGSSQLSGTWG